MKRFARRQRIRSAGFNNHLIPLSTTLGALLLASPAAVGQALFTYTFADVSTSSGLTSVGGSITGATFSSFTAVGTPANPNASGRFSFTDWSTGALTGSDVFTGGINVDEYYQFSITPASGFALNLDTITFTIQRSSTGIRQYSVRSDMDGYASNLPASNSGTTTALSVVNTPQENIFQITDTATSATNGSTLTLGAKYDAVTSAITFRFYGWNSEGKAGTFSIDNVAVFGSAAPNAPPIYWDANGSTAGLGGAGNWNSDHWSSDAAGAGAATSFDSAKKAVFAGTAGNVSIGTAGVAANAGLQFDVDGYTISGTNGALTLGGDAPRIAIADPAHKATISAIVTGQNGFTKTGSGAVVLTGDNSYTGTTTIAGGTLEISRDQNLGATTAGVALNDGTLKVVATTSLHSDRSITGTGILDISAGSTLTINGLLNAGNITLAGSGTLELNGASSTIMGLTFNAPATVKGSASLALNGNINVAHASGTSSISSALDLGLFATTSGNRAITVTDPSAKLVISGAITLVAPVDNGQPTPAPNNNGRLHKLGAGTLELTGSNSGLFGVRLGSAATSSGSTPVAPVTGGTLRIGNKQALGSNAFQFNAGTLEVMQPLTGANAIAIPITIGASSDLPAIITGSDVEFSGEVQLFKPSQSIQHTLVVNSNVRFSGALNAPTSTSGFSTGLTIAGTGSLTLAAPSNTIAEPITVDGPRVTLNGSLTASSGMLVKSGSLTGNGSLPVGTLTIGDGAAPDATFAPGEGITTFKIGGLSLESDAVFHLEINSALKISDTVAVTGIIGLGNGIAKLEVVDLGSAILPVGTEFTLIDNEGLGPVLGYFKGLGNLSRFSTGKNLFEIDYGSTTAPSDVVLRVVPEPCTMLLLFAGAALSSGLGRPSRKRL